MLSYLQVILETKANGIVIVLIEYIKLILGNKGNVILIVLLSLFEFILGNEAYDILIESNCLIVLHCSHIFKLY